MNVMFKETLHLCDNKLLLMIRILTHISININVWVEKEIVFQLYNKYIILIDFMTLSYSMNVVSAYIHIRT